MAILSTTNARDVMDEIAIRLNEISADESDAYLTGINLCTRDIAISFPEAPFLYASADRTLSSGTRMYTHMPSDFEKMINVTYPAGDTKLKYLTEEEFAALQPSATESGTPTIYTIHGNLTTANSQIEFYPQPGSSITLHYNYRILYPQVSAVSAAVPIPAKYIDLYMLYGEMRGLRRREDYQQADAVEQRYEALKQKMIEDFKKMTQEPWRVKSIREFTQANKTYGDEIVDLFWGNDNQ